VLSLHTVYLSGEKQTLTPLPGPGYMYKGYGFIAPDEDLPDVLLHVTCLRHGGFQAASEGARVVCEVVKSSKGLQAVRICCIDAHPW
jgi:cold shock CspA family protein